MKIIAHRVGNKINGESLMLSQYNMQLNEEMAEQLKNYFLGSFKSEETFQFYSDSYLVNNPVYNSVSKIFESPIFSFSHQAENIAQHLYDSAENPRIQGGELFVVFFPGEEPEQNKIGIFKTEKRESFLKLSFNNDCVEVEKDQGVSLSKIDKAALIFNTGKETGYVIEAVDNNKNGDMYYWFEDFLKIKQREDEYFHTQETLMIFKDYITKQLPQELEINKVDQVNFLNKSLNYFKEKNQFELDEFTSEVLETDEVIESFNSFKTDYEQDMRVNVAEEFKINSTAVKKMQRHFKGIIKLDKNFQIHIQGDQKKLEHGEDEKGKFYQLYFDKEQ